MADPPIGIRAISESRVLEVEWPSGERYHIPFHILRAECLCAECVSAQASRQTIAEDTTAEGLDLDRMGFAGNYALRIVWSDDHTSSYDWEHLQTICRMPLVSRLRDLDGDTEVEPGV